MSGKINSIKAKLRFGLSTSAEDKKRLQRAYSTAISGLELALRIVKETSGVLGVPGLQAGIGSLLFVFDVIQKTSQNVENIEQLSKRIGDLTMVLQNSKISGTFSESLINRMDRLSNKWNSVADDVRNMPSRHVIKRVIHYSDDALLISNHIRTISWSIESFIVETMLALEFALDEQQYTALRIESNLDNVGQKMDSGFQQLNMKLDVKDGHPPYATLARFDSKIRSPCFEGTRKEIFDQVYKWIGATENRNILWINGSAGTGKTTIAYTVAQACRVQSVLGASFFCSRDNAECSNPNLIFTTIAYQLGQFFPSFNVELTRVVQKNPDIGYSDISYQLEELIIKPLRVLRNAFPACVVVLDALDECKDNAATSIILSSLSRYIAELSPLKILITSRPEQHITHAFSTHLTLTTQRLVLHEVEPDVVQNDIERYLTSNLALIRNSHHLESAWPTVVDVHALALLSVGLFIFAATSIKFIEDRNYCDPRGQLADLLRNTAEVAQSPSSPHRRLDQLYTEVLIRAFPDISPRLAGRLKMVLGSIILLRDPLSPTALEQLLNLKVGTVRETLLYLHSVVIVPDDDIQVIRLHHPSFFDFMSSPTRCSNPKFVVNAKTQHTLLVRTCLTTMKTLKRDICGIKNPAILNNEVGDLSKRITRHIPPYLQYACRHWIFHFMNSMISDVLLVLVEEFCSKYLLYWVEVCSLLGELRGALLALKAAQTILANVGENTAPIIGLLYDCERFTREFFQVLSVSSLQVYHSALLFAPEQTLIHNMYGHELVLPMKVYNVSGKAWHRCTRTMDGHSDFIYAVAFSPDGSRVVSGSLDATLRLWDAVSGMHLSTYTGHSGSVWSVAFSPDGTRTVSGSFDGTLQLWDAVNGGQLSTLRGHSGSVWSVAFSPNGTRIASGSYDKTLRLWDAATGVQLNTLTGHTDWVYSVMFSPDSARVVSGSHDKTLRLWNATTGTHSKTFIGHSSKVNTVTFSPDGTRVLSGSDDKSLRLWDAASGKHLNTFTGHSDKINSVDFSSDGTRVVSGSDDKTLRLWDAVSGVHLHTLMGHSDSVHSVVFSPDGTRIMSGSSDKTLRLWDAVSDAHIQKPTGHSGRVRALAFSPDGTRVVSGSEDKALRLWDAAGGVHRDTFVGHSDSVCAVAFSPDGTRIVSGSYDTTLRQWGANGTVLNTLKGHSDFVTSVTFSPDGSRILSGSRDTTLRLWDAVSGALIHTLMGHSDWVHAVEFSPDGSHIVSGSSDKTLRLWDAVTGTLVNVLTGHSGPVWSIAFLPKGNSVVSGSYDKTLRLWDAASGTNLYTFTGHVARDSATLLAHTLTLLRSSLPLSHFIPSDTDDLTFGYLMENEWILSLPQKRRLCWIPVSCRPGCLAWSGNRVAMGTEDGRVVILDFTGMV